MSTELLYDWNIVGKTLPIFANPIELCDETLRDGIQSPSVCDPTIDAKLRMVDCMEAIGITIADIGLPGAGERAVQDVTRIAKHVRDKRMKLRVNCAARTIIHDIEPIVRIQHDVGIPVVAYCFLGTSPIRQYVEDWSADMLLKTCDEAISFAIREGLETAFVTEDTIRSAPEILEKLFRHVISLGCRRLVLCDTVGHATPDGARNLVWWTRGLIKSTGEDVKIDWHGHNDRGLAVSNSIFAAEAGADRLHGTCLGLGERVGNASLDQLIVNLKLLDAYPHDVSRLFDYVKLTAEACKVGLPYNYPAFGMDAFRTATGVHASAVIKAAKKGDQLLADTVYSGVPANWFGRQQEIEIGPMSGLSNVRHWLHVHGYEADEKLVHAILEYAKTSDHVLSGTEVSKVIGDRMQTGG